MALAWTPPDDVHHGVLAQADIAADQAVAEPVLMQLEHLLGLAFLSAQHDAAGFGGREAGLDTFPDEITLEFGQTSHDGAHQLAAGGAHAEAQSGWRKDADLPWPGVRYATPRIDALSASGVGTCPGPSTTDRRE